MMEFGWILLSIGLLIILLILINSSKSHQKHTTMLTIKKNFIFNDDDPNLDLNQVVALRLSPTYKRDVKESITIIRIENLPFDMDTENVLSFSNTNFFRSEKSIKERLIYLPYLLQILSISLIIFIDVSKSFIAGPVSAVIPTQIGFPSFR